MKQSGNDGQMRWYHVVIVILYAALLVAMALVLGPQFASAATGPEVTVQVIYGGEGYQLERWDYGQYNEAQERFCGTVSCVNAYLTHVGEEYTYSVSWTEASND